MIPGQRSDFTDYLFQGDDDDKPKKMGYKMNKELGSILQSNEESPKSSKLSHLFRKKKDKHLAKAIKQIDDYK